jgi:hypothetical protein
MKLRRYLFESDKGKEESGKERSYEVNYFPSVTLPMTSKKMRYRMFIHLYKYESLLSMCSFLKNVFLFYARIILN